LTTRPQDLTCDRCGIEFTLSNSALAKRRERGTVPDLCADCETIDKPIVGYYNNCRGFGGDVDEFDRPIRNGKLYKPGVRTCGRVDCVRVAHIIPDPKPERPQKRAVSQSETIKVIPQPVSSVAVIKPSQVRRVMREQKPVKLPKAMLEALEAERFDQTYKGQPKRSLKQLKKTVELERYL